MPKITAKQVANLFLYWANKNGDLITNLKMQKLLYYAQAWHLVNFNQRLFRDKILAWKLGPVIEGLYQEWKHFGYSPIKHTNTEREASPFSRPQLKFLEEFFAIYSNLSSTAMVSMTHAEAPWKNAIANGENTEISPVEMKEFYEKQYEKLNE